jgi:putative transposase
MRNPFRCFKGSPEIIRLTVLIYIRYPLSLRQVEDLLYSYSNWRWHLDEVFVRINGETH